MSTPAQLCTPAKLPGCAVKCQSTCTERQKALLIYRISSTPTRCKCRQAERENASETHHRAGTAAWPQMCPTSPPTTSLPPWNLYHSQTARADLSCSAESSCSSLPSGSASALCFHVTLVRHSGKHGLAEQCHWNIHFCQNCYPKEIRAWTYGEQGALTRISEKKYSTVPRKKPQGKKTGCRDRKWGFKNLITTEW